MDSRGKKVYMSVPIISATSIRATQRGKKFRDYENKYIYIYILQEKSHNITRITSYFEEKKSNNIKRIKSYSRRERL